MRLLHVDGDEDRLLAALLFESAGTPEEDTLAAVGRLSDLGWGARLRALLTDDAGDADLPTDVASASML